MTRGKLKRENISRSGKVVKVIYISAGALFLFLIAAGVFAGAADRLLYTEEFETGKAEISLQELDVTGGEMDMIPAGKRLCYVPRIVNEGADCFVRARICVTADGDRPQEDADEYIYGMGTDWVKAGEYYYYRNILKRGESEDVIDGISVPVDWSNDTAQTGDPSDLRAFAVTAVLAVAVMGVIAIWRRKGERD